jgi:hypothetical protein
MKKLLRRLRREKPREGSSRITNETIAEHRERILAGGRRFKYPVQYARHRLVFNIIIIAVIAIVILVAVIWQQLYFAQNTSDFMYRVTKVLPLPVANIDGQDVAYSDYLMKYRSSIKFIQEQEQVSLKTEDGKIQSDHFKEESMQNAIANAYAIKLAHEKGITISDSELELFIKQQRKTYGDISQASYDAIILDYYGWSPDENRHITSIELLHKKVAYAVDTQAIKTSDAVEAAVKAGNRDLQSIADTLNADPTTPVEHGVSGMVPKNNQDGGLADAASAMKKDDISPVIKSTTGNGYYIIKLLDSNDTQVSYEFIHVALTTFVDQLAALKKADKIKEYIAVPKVAEQTTN